MCLALWILRADHLSSSSAQHEQEDKLQGAVQTFHAGEYPMALVWLLPALCYDTRSRMVLQNRTARLRNQNSARRFLVLGKASQDGIVRPN
ncbi:hypothetical protein E4U21_001806 [Claviceps maximensis]|nr:hypothetical protein E4U21_001806 [Claviceps maximensis]